MEPEPAVLLPAPGVRARQRHHLHGSPSPAASCSQPGRRGHSAAVGSGAPPAAGACLWPRPGNWPEAPGFHGTSGQQPAAGSASTPLADCAVCSHVLAGAGGASSRTFAGCAGLCHDRWRCQAAGRPHQVCSSLTCCPQHDAIVTQRTKDFKVTYFISDAQLAEILNCL